MYIWKYKVGYEKHKKKKKKLMESQIRSLDKFATRNIEK